MVSFEWMERRHLKAVLAIENSCFDSPWTEKTFCDTLRNRNVRGMVAVVDGKIVGYMVYMRCRQGIEVYSIAVDAEHRRQGIARGFIDKLKAKLVKDVVAIVRDKNLAAQLFFKNQDFRATQVLRKWYDNGEDGYMMKFASSVERYKPTNRISNFFVSTTGQ